ncbi:MAG: hypothetical protein HY727_09805 [Candidatus Rokubacteria bacterium]|nr:hypothetical protein [Candidatus Rokubacteria bacterium]
MTRAWLVLAIVAQVLLPGPPEAGEVTLRGTIVRAPESKLKEGHLEGYTITIKVVDEKTKKAREETVRISGSATDLTKGKQGLSVKALQTGQKVTVVLYDDKDPKKTARSIVVEE